MSYGVWTMKSPTRGIRAAFHRHRVVNSVSRRDSERASHLAADFQAEGFGRSLVYFMLAAPLGCIFATLIVFSKTACTQFPLLAKISIIGRYAFFWALLGGLILSGYTLLWLTRMSSL